MNTDERIEDMHHKINDLHKLLHGNGAPERGIVARMLLLEQAQKIRDRWFWLVAGAAVASLAASIL